MTAEQRFERSLPALLEELGESSLPDYRDSLLGRTAAMRQRPAWTFPERWIPVDITMRRVTVAPFNWRLLALAALLVLAGVAIAIVGAAANRRLPAPPYGPAANGLIAYAEMGDIYLGDPATGDSSPIISGFEVDQFPGFSRDGTKMGFVRMAPFVGHYLMEANADGSDIHKVTPQPFDAISAGDVTGDNRFEVVASEVDGRSTLSIIDIAHGSVRILDVGMPAMEPRFRPPDGREILFERGNGDHAMYLVDIDGGTPRRLALGGGPMYSPDGSRIAYFIIENRPNSTEILKVRLHVMNADGTDDRILADEAGIWYQNPREWSPDGSSVLVIRGYHDGRRTLAVVPADGSGLGVEYMVPIVGDWGPTGWSPDGRFIYFAGDEATEATLIDTLKGSTRPVPLWYTSAWQRLGR
jgi:Tol biopolymer transport system component